MLGKENMITKVKMGKELTYIHVRRCIVDSDGL